MKSAYRLFCLSFLFVSFSFCSSSDSEEELIEVLEVTSVSEFSAYQETKTVEITANMYWFTDIDVNWITVTPRYGTNNATLEVTAATNTTFEQRTGVITVNGGSLVKTITITQAAREVNSGELDPNLPPSQNFDLSTLEIKYTRKQRKWIC